MIFNLKKTNQGFSLLEIVFYISLFAIIAILVINSLIVMMNSFREIKINNDLFTGAIIVEKISREIKQADSFSLTNLSTLNLSTSLGGVNKQIVFSLNNDNQIEYYEDGVLIGYLNHNNLLVQSLVFNVINTNHGLALHFKISAISKANLNKTINFQNTLKLRGTY